MKKTIFTSFLLLILSGILLSLHAELIDVIRRKYNLKTSLESDVSLTIFWKIREKKETKTGHFLIAPGDRFRVKLGNTLWVCDGQTFWQYNSKTSQVIIKRLLDINLSSHPSQMLSNYLMNYTYSPKKEDDRSALLEWKAGSGSAELFYRYISLAVDKKKNVITELFVVDKNGNESTYLFKKTKFGVQTPGDVFNFKVPEGVDVLDARE